jgi:A/G-specific adenine glycosylase
MKMMSAMNIKRKQIHLLEWYRVNRRDLPWRQTNDSYSIWISEVMLQQTQVDTVLSYYRRFLERFPEVSALAAADLSQVLKTWEGLGYYARARNLHKAAGIILDDYKGEIPRDYASLKLIPGIGDYTAAAIASIAFGEPAPVLDGNARRVLARWMALHEATDSVSGSKKLRVVAKKNMYAEDPGTWNQAVMELGALVCIPRTPRCEACPVTADCEAYRQKATLEIPLRRKRQPIPHYQVTAALIRHRGKLLITRRPEKGLLGGLWEFPGGKQEEGETLQECLARELKEELDVVAQVREEFCRVDHAYTHFKITLHVFHARIVSGQPKAIQVAEVRWVKQEELGDYAFPRADRRVIELLMPGTTQPGESS